ncbi:L,D-transpeptidase [Flammeovirga kamogawensis]|uniref:L,D-transpeptidase family protein n=1 Tax=Flammeovirga kamogawensis TaxID=373891 RepID=A0ABX8GTT5_9BACT|nr:L,D-transpeptidase [Flammeovirga kamogawensis]MBB6463371.1 hypothetical protein [Flammeovirga kamogawensis]QWG06657.1 L,D-transpeptidase family protein [Flammeovirga kamogawensis]TRX68479.1 L,D-transpeptidase family protein [Flammeovirga kamogawensis]
MNYYKRYIYILSIFIIVCSCSQPTKNTSVSSADLFTTDDFNWKELTGKAIYVTSRARTSAKIQEEVFQSVAMQELEEAKLLMPESLKELTDKFINSLYEKYPEMTEHQKMMLKENAKCGMQVLSKKSNPKRYSLIHSKLTKAFTYLRKNKEIQSGYAFVGNLAHKNVGGQKGYIINMATGELVEIDISSAWKGIGFEDDSGKTPIGFFLVYQKYTQPGWQSRTKTGTPKKMFYKLHRQTYDGEAKYIYRKSTKEEKAYICTNQFGLIGQNFGSEFVDVAATKYLRKSPDDLSYIDNSNSGTRQLYIHGTNREDQLGFALSGGCVRVSNINSYIIKEIVMKQETMPVFLDAVALHAPKPVKVPGFDDTDLESIYNEQSIVIRRQNMLDSVSLAKHLQGVVIPKLANSIAYRMSKVENQKANVTISVSVPFPESAMKYWMTFIHSGGVNNINFQQRFGFKGEYFETEMRHNQNPFYKAYYSADINSYFKNRITEARIALNNNLTEALQKHEIDKELIQNINIQEQTMINEYFNKELEVIDPLEYFAISEERKRVLHYMGMIDTLAVEFPGKFEEWEHLTWINSYLSLRESGPDSQPKGDLDYYDALLMQSYIYALGEQELYEREVKSGRLLPIKGQEFQNKLLNQYGIDGALTLLDEAGMWRLFQYSHSSENKTLIKMVSVAYPKQEMLKGMQLLAESYFSKFKWISNQYVITSEVNGEAITLAD